MPDVRRTYTAPAIDPPTAAVKPAYFYYTPAAQTTDRRQPMEQFSVPRDQQQRQFVGEPIARSRTPVYASGSPKKSGGAKTADIGEFRQDPDGTIVLVQPAPVDPHASRIKCLKFFIFGSNVVLLIVGVALLAFGAWLKADDRFRDLLSENFRQAACKQIDPVFYVGTYIILAVALVMIIVSFFGCCGAILENTCLLAMYFILLIVVFFLQVSLMVLVLMKKDKIEVDVGDLLDCLVQHYYQGPGIVTDVMDMLQVTFRCCGNSGCADYSWLRMNVPRSCDIQCDGCRYRMFRFFKDGFIVLGVAMVLVFVAEILAISFSLYLSCFMRQHPTTRKRYFYYKSAEPEKRIPISSGPITHVGRPPVKRPL